MKLYLQESILVLLIQLGLNTKVLNVTLDWNGEEGNIPKDAYKGESDRPRSVIGTDRTATKENTGVSMLFLRHKVYSQERSEAQLRGVPFFGC